MMKWLIVSVLACAAMMCAAFRPDPLGDRAAASLARVKAAADAGNAEALYRLGMLYDRGYDTIRPDTLLANTYYLRAADGCYAPAMGLLGFRMLTGEGATPRDTTAGLTLLRRGAEAGDARSLNNLGWLMLFGPASLHAPQEGIEMLQQAAEAGLPAAKASMGRACEEGIGTEADADRAAQWYAEALDAGFAPAAEGLWRLRSADYETLAADSALKVGLHYYLGAAPALGVAVLEMAASKGSAHAMALLGDAAAKARGREYGHDAAVRAYYRAARAGYAPAQFILAELLESFPDALQGIAGEEEPREDAAYWRNLARAGGVASAAEAERRLYGTGR